MRLNVKAVAPIFRDKDDTQFVVHDIDESADPKYYGQLHYSGAWIIAEFTTDTTLRYAVGNPKAYPTDDDYPTAWAARTGLTYDYINNILPE